MIALAKNLAARGIYYGWVIVGVGFLAGFTKAGLTSTLFNVFLKPISEDFGWTRAMTAGAVTIGTLAAGFAALFIGNVVDRRGTRLVLGLGGIILGATYIGLGLINALWNFYVIFAVGRALALGAVSDTMTSTAIANWFVKSRARAIAITITGTGFGGLVLSPLVQAIIDNYGWRMAWIVLGLLTWALLVLPAVLLIHRRPEDVGLTLEGQDPVEKTARKSSGRRAGAVGAAAPEYSWTLKEASGTLAFALLNIAMAVASLANGAVGFHMVAFLTDQGISTGSAATALGFYAAASVLSNFAWGYLADRLHSRYCIILSLIGAAASTMLLSATTTDGLAFLSMILYGFFAGGFWMLCHVIWAVYFGREHLGSIRGVAVFLQMIGLSFGPLLGALVFDTVGSYHLAFYGATALNLFAWSLFHMARPPRRADSVARAATISV